MDNIDVTNLGEVKNGDVLVVRYKNLPEAEERRKDYVAIRDYFANQGIRVRLLGVTSDMTLETVTESEMNRYGWYKKR